MTTARLDWVGTEGPVVQSLPSTRRVFFAVWGQVWLLTVFGGGGCGVACAGFVSLVFFFWTIPAGMYFGAFLGIPFSLINAIVLTRWATPPGDPMLLTRRLESVGIRVAVIIVASINLYLAGAASFFADLNNRVLVVLALIINGLVAALAAAYVGRECGHVLAARHMKRFGLTSPPRRPIVLPLVVRVRALW